MSDDFQLPPLPPTGALPSRLSRKRARDYEFSSSSDPPVFSSDPPEPSCLGPSESSKSSKFGRNDSKRQYRGSWWGTTDVRPRPREKRKFTRTQDSGVWFGSEESESSNDLSLDGTNRDPRDPGEQVVVARSLSEDKMPTAGHLESGVPEDEGFFTEDACEQRNKMREQMPSIKVAEAIVMVCLESGKENIDLSFLPIDPSNLNSILRPLRYFTKIPRVHDPYPPGEQLYESLAPSLRLFLSQSKLNIVPREVLGLKDLTVLSLRINNLTELPPRIGKLMNLTELNVSSNELRWLPFEILKLKKLKRLSVLPNPLHLSSESDQKEHQAELEMELSEATKAITTLPTGEMSRIETGYPIRLPLTSHVAFLAIDGLDNSSSTGFPNPELSIIEDSDSSTYQPVPPTGSSNHSKCQSLLEIALKACSRATQFSELADMLGPNGPPLVSRILEHAAKVKEMGGQECTICGRRFILPRTEWIEWWVLEANKSTPLPLIRRGCTWSCIPSARDASV